MPSPNSPSKTGVNALLVGEGCSVFPHDGLGEGSARWSEPLTQFPTLRRCGCPLPQGEEMSNVGRTKNPVKSGFIH